MRLEFSRYVEQDLDEIANWIAQDNPSRAVTFIQEIRNKLHWISQAPLLYQVRPDIGREARLATVGRYVILFLVTDETIRVERVVSGARNLPETL